MTILFFAQCSNMRNESEANKFLNEINKAASDFEDKNSISKARNLIINSVSKNLIINDSIILVESLDKDGLYQCVSYTSHNQMITFYNAKKNPDSSSEQEYIQATGRDTPYEALTFLDAIQNNNFEEFYRLRNEKEDNQNKKWLISFVSKKEGKYKARTLISK